MGKYNIDDDTINDLKVLITGNLVMQGFIKDCTDTNDDTEFEIQDIIEEALKERLQ